MASSSSPRKETIQRLERKRSTWTFFLTIFKLHWKVTLPSEGRQREGNTSAKPCKISTSVQKSSKRQSSSSTFSEQSPPFERRSKRPLSELTSTQLVSHLSFFIESRDFGYSIGLMIEKEADIEMASDMITQFCHRLNLDISLPPRGKVLEFIRMKNPNHYDALERCGLIGKKLGLWRQENVFIVKIT